MRIHKVSGLAEGACGKCGKGQRGVVMFEDLSLGVQCVECGHVDKDIDAEFVEDAADRDALEGMFGDEAQG